MKFNKAKAEVKTFQQLFRSLADIQDLLDEPGKLERELRTMRKQKDEVERDLQSSRRLLAEAKTEIKAIDDSKSDRRAIADRIVHDAEEHAKRMRDKGHQDGEAAYKKGQAEADKIVGEAYEKAAAKAAEADKAAERLAKIKKEAQYISAESAVQADKAEADLVAVRKEIAAAERQLAAVHAEVDGLRRKFAS